MVIPSAPTPLHAGATGDDSETGDWTDRLTVTADRRFGGGPLFLGSATVFTATVCNPSGVDSLCIDAVNTRLILGGKTCRASWSPSAAVKRAGCSGREFWFIPWESPCEPGRFNDFWGVGGPSADLLNLSIINTATGDTVTVGHYVLLKKTSWSDLVNGGSVGAVPEHWSSLPHWPIDLPPYGDCIAIRFTLSPPAPDALPPGILEPIPYSLMVEAISLCPDTVRVAVDRATLALGDGREISVQLTAPGDRVDSVFSGVFEIPSDASEVGLKLHVLVTHPGNPQQIGVPFTLRDDLLLLPRCVLEHLRQ